MKQNSLKLLKPQSNLALTQVDPRLKIAIKAYIQALEEIAEAYTKLQGDEKQ